MNIFKDLYKYRELLKTSVQKKLEEDTRTRFLECYGLS